MRKIILVFILIFVLSKNSFAAPIAYGKWEPAKYYLDCPIENIAQGAPRRGPPTEFPHHDSAQD